MQVLPALDIGGVEQGTIDMAGAIARAGWRSIVVSRGGARVREVEKAGALHVALPVDAKNPATMLRNVMRLRALIAEHGVALVHARSRAPAWSAMLAARRAGVPFVTTFHGTYDVGTPFKYWYGKVMTRGARVIAISDFIAGYVHATFGTDPARIVTIPRGVDVARFDPERVSGQRMINLAQAWRLPDGAQIVMLPGRLTRWKGQLVLIDALARLGRPDVLGLLVGSDQGRERYRAEIEAAIRDRGLAGQLRIVDDCPDMPAAYMLADVVVSASTEPEAFGRVAAEGQAMGRLVVATDHGGSRETVAPGVTGWLVPPADAATLAAALAEALSFGAERRLAVGRAARSRVVERFTVERMCEATLALYREVMAEHAAARRPAAA